MNAAQITNYVETVSATVAIMALIAGSVYKWRQPAEGGPEVLD